MLSVCGHINENAGTLQSQSDQICWICSYRRRSEENLWELVPFFHHVSPGDWWQAPLHKSERCFKETHVSYITILNYELAVVIHKRGWGDQ